MGNIDAIVSLKGDVLCGCDLFLDLMNVTAVSSSFLKNLYDCRPDLFHGVTLRLRTGQV